MGTSGVSWECDEDTIITTLKKAKGRISYAAKALSVHPQTLKKRIDANPELVQLLSDLRNDFDATMLDAAENCLLAALSKQEEDMGNALKSSFFILNNKGRERGYSPKNNPNNNGVSEEGFIRELALVISGIEKENQLAQALADPQGRSCNQS